MGASTLSSRAIIGRFYRTLEQDTGAAWVNDLSMLFNSDQGSEEYKWLGQTPAMREWVGGRHAKGFNENGLTIANKHYEGTLEVDVADMRRDKTGQIMVRVDELAQRTNSHWASLLSTLTINGESNVCYDGQFFFDTDHSEGNSGTQSNDIASDISAIPAAVHGSTTDPSPQEMSGSIFAGIQQILSFVDDQGEPMNENANQFLVQVPISLMKAAMSAVSDATFGGGETNTLNATGFSIRVAPNARLSSWTDKFAVYRTDGFVKPFIRQQETDVMLKAVAEGSELEFTEDKHHYGVDAWRNVGYGYWQHGCLVTLT